MRRYEIMEIKHGRAAMLGFLHVIALHAGVRVPGYLSTSQNLKFEDVPAGCFASLEAVPTAGWLQIMVLTCMQETGYFYAEAQTDDKEPGDIATDGWVRYDDPETKTFKLNAERQNGRAAMLGVTGAWAAENGTGIPWFTAGTLCTPDDCTAVADKFPGAVAPLAPEGSGYPSFWAVLAIEVVLVGLAEAYRTGLTDPAFDELTVGDVSPGGRFDPLGLAESGDLEELKIKELKHCRLSMFAWLGCISQGLATQEGPIANWQAHVADPVHANVLTNAASGFGFY